MNRFPSIGTPEFERMKGRSQEQHRTRIEEAYERAMLCREQYEEQLAAEGEIGRDLQAELAAAAGILWMETHIYGDYPAVEDIYPDSNPTTAAQGFDGHVADRPDADPEMFVECIDAIDEALQKLEFVGGLDI